LAFQSSNTIRTSVELVKLEKTTIKEIEQLPFYKYSIKFPLSYLDNFYDVTQAYYHIEKLFRAKYNYSSLAKLNGEFFIVSPVEVNDNSIDADDKIEVKRNSDILQLQLSNRQHVEIFTNLLYQNLRVSLVNAGFSVKGSTAIDTSKNLINWVSTLTADRTFQKLRPFISLFPAFHFGLRQFENDFFIQVSPRSVIDYSKDLYWLLAEQVFTNDELEKTIENVTLPIGRTAKLYGILKTDAATPIDERPFNGETFLDFAAKWYPYLSFAHRDAKLILVLPFGNSSSPYYFSSELVKPSVRFPVLAEWDRSFYANLGSEMKRQSATRYELIEKYLREVKFKFFSVDLKLANTYYIEKTHEILEPSEFPDRENLQVFEFSHPWLSFRDRESGRVVDVKRNTTLYWGSTVDLLNHEELACFDSPQEIKVKAITYGPLFGDACHLMDTLRDGFEEYKGFEKIFGTKLSFEVSSTDDLLSNQIYSDITSSNYDCVLIFGPRHLPEGAEKSKIIYTYPETEILNRGVPVQFITDDPSPNKTYDKSLKTKSNDSSVLFGIGLNVLGKIGATVMKLSPKSTSFFLPNSIVLGYNVSRLFLPLSKDVKQDHSPRELVRTSTPLAAPLVMMSQDGAEILTQAVYPIPNETALFKEDRAELMISNLPEQFHFIIIHKDGPFYPPEIADIKNLQQNGRTIIPVSIVSFQSPRIFSTFFQWNRVPPTGTIMKLSSVDYLMVNSLTTQRYSAESRGWPNTVLVTIHEEALQKKGLTELEKRQILYQIWALTRVHVGSQLPTRKPISIHYSDSMATFLRKVGNPSPEYFSHFGTLRNRFGYMPRIFL
jgi:hypothetical protein